MCYVDHPEEIPQGSTWRAPRDLQLYEKYARNARARKLQVLPQPGGNPSVPTQQHESAQKGYAAIPPGGGGQYNQHRGGGGGRGGGGRGRSGRGITWGQSHQAANLTVQGAWAPPPHPERQQPQARSAPPQSDTQRMHEQAARVEALPGGIAPGTLTGFGWQSTGMLLERVESTELFTFGSTPPTYTEALVTTRATKIADMQQAAAPAVFAAAPPATASEAMERMRGATATADAIHAKVEQQRQQQLQAAAQQQAELQREQQRATSQARGVLPTQVRPQPHPFTTTPMPSNLPASSLPDPVRRARAGSIALPGQASTGFERELAQSPQVGLAPTDGAGVAVQTLMGLGTGVLEGLMGRGFSICFRGTPSGESWELPLSCLEVRLPFEVVAELHGQQDKAGRLQQPAQGLLPMPAGVEDLAWAPAPASASRTQGVPAAGSEPAQVEARPRSGAAESSAAGAAKAVVEVAAAAQRVPQQQELEGLDESVYGDEYCEVDEPQGGRPQHLSCYNMVNDVVVATSEMVPAVYTFPATASPLGVTFRSSPNGPALATQRVILDTGANVVLASLDWVERNGLEWLPAATLQLRTSSGGTFSACGRLAQPLIVVLCAGTPEELKVAVDCYVMRDQSNLYELLIGTPFVNAVGGEISSFTNSFTYRPQLHKRGGDAWATHSMQICTYTGCAGEAYKESNRFLLGAVLSWFD